jgi:hypothetical protein
MSEPTELPEDANSAIELETAPTERRVADMLRRQAELDASQAQSEGGEE